jgi:hypothetical protein
MASRGVTLRIFNAAGSVLISDSNAAHVLLCMAVNLIQVEAEVHRFALQRRIGWGREL